MFNCREYTAMVPRKVSRINPLDICAPCNSFYFLTGFSSISCIPCKTYLASQAAKGFPDQFQVIYGFEVFSIPVVH